MRRAFDADGTARRLASLAGDETSTAFPHAVAAQLERSELGAASLSLAWELARLSGEKDPMAAALVILLLLDASRLGSTALDLDAGAHHMERAAILGLGMEAHTVTRGMRLTRAGELLTSLIGGARDRRPFVRTGTHLALSRHVALEERLASILAQRAHASPPATPIVDETTPLVSIHGPVSLTSEQRAAVHAAVTGRQVVIAGGPGTGKTSIVAAIVRALAGGASPVVPPAAVALAAPTGKAADRLFASLSQTLANERSDGGRALLDTLSPASTLHRLLGYRAHDDTFTFHAKNPLPHRLVIVDEASMLDLALAERLVSALASDARLVLLGDPDQLPSVDAGAVLDDLVESAARGSVLVPVHRLTQSHRMDASDVSGARVLALASRIRMGELGEIQRIGDLAAAVAHASGPALYSPDEVGLSSFLRGYFARVAGPILAEAARPLDLTSEADRALTTSLLGAQAVNELFAREVHGRDAGWAFAPGEPLLAVRNDYDRELMNGDQGLVVRLRSGELAGAFLRAGRIVSHPLDAIRGTVERAYATTVHKAQGSEHDHVVLLLPQEAHAKDTLPLLARRELVYTAVTRARRSALIVGDLGVLSAAVKSASHRVTGLRSALARNGQADLGD